MADELNEGADQAADAVTGGEEQTQEVQASEPLGDEAQAQQSASEIVVGNQRFPNQEALIKAYQESQRGFTQATQKSAQELKALQGLKSWLVGIKGDKAKWERFISFVNGGHEQPAQTQMQRQGPAQVEQRSPVVDDVSDRLTRAEAALELQSFRGAHPDAAPEVMNKMFDLMEEAEDRGEKMSLEAAYRYVMHDDFAQKLVSEGQRKAEDSLKKGQKAVSLGANPASAGARTQPKTPWSKRQGAQGQNQRIAEIFDEQGVKFDKE